MTVSDECPRARVLLSFTSCCCWSADSDLVSTLQLSSPAWPLSVHLGPLVAHALRMRPPPAPHPILAPTHAVGSAGSLDLSPISSCAAARLPPPLGTLVPLTDLPTPFLSSACTWLNGKRLSGLSHSTRCRERCRERCGPHVLQLAAQAVVLLACSPHILGSSQSLGRYILRPSPSAHSFSSPSRQQAWSSRSPRSASPPRWPLAYAHSPPRRASRGKRSATERTRSHPI